MPSVALFHDGSGDLLKLIKCPLVYLDRQYDPVAKLGEEVVWLKNIIESLRLALDLPPMESSRVTEYNQETLECLRRELKILRVGLQERGWPPFVPFPLVHARPRLQYPGLEKEAFIEVPCEGLTPPLISLVQHALQGHGMLKIVDDSLLEPFTLLLLNRAVKTCANDASCRLPFSGRCCVCTLPLPCAETSHNYTNEMILSGRYKLSTLEATIDKGSAASVYYSRSLEANLTGALNEFGLSSVPASHADDIESCPVGTTGGREDGGICSPSRRSMTAGPTGGSPSGHHTEPMPSSTLWRHEESKGRSPVSQNGNGRVGAEDGIQGDTHSGESRFPQAVPPSFTMKKNPPAMSPSAVSKGSKHPGFKRSYQEALLEPLQLRSPQGSSGFPRNRLVGDLDVSPFTAAALSDGGGNDQAEDRCDVLFAGCLPERYRRDREVTMESLDSKRRSREFEAAQVAKMLAIEEYRERRLNAKLKELEEKKQREIENQNYLKEKERKREMRNRFLRKQLEEYYGKKETAK
uniref:Uncharacterized protein n=1 Tax=Neospora caninum (strain Liverpool) TaxID=572307 RepID=A0A0F7UKD3_NEOCL|nr:TPA: hypothetical protein BN1204_047120 [Neospora caninum Liverpool]